MLEDNNNKRNATANQILTWLDRLNGDKATNQSRTGPKPMYGDSELEVVLAEWVEDREFGQQALSSDACLACKHKFPIIPSALPCLCFHY